MVDKIAEGMSMFLSGPVTSFAGVGLELACQAAKGIKDNMQHYRRQRQSGRGIASTIMLHVPLVAITHLTNHVPYQSQRETRDDILPIA